MCCIEEQQTIFQLLLVRLHQSLFLDCAEKDPRKLNGPEWSGVNVTAKSPAQFYERLLELATQMDTFQH